MSSDDQGSGIGDRGSESAHSRWGRVRDLFERAHDEQPRDISEWLDRQGVDDWQVREEVRSLLRHHSSAGSFLLNPAGDQLAALIRPERRLEPGQVVGAYTVIRELGRGGMGQVYLARDRIDREVALKAVSPDLAVDPAYRDRLKREASIAGKLKHPGICIVYALEEIEGELFIVHEYIDGHTLRDEMGTSRPPVADVMRTARELAAALAHAHRQGVIHRDIKPENVMRTEEGHVKILDFGLARVESADDGVMNQLTRPGTIMGTPAYMAPEQFSGVRADARADVWALGVMLYEYACGVHPFTAETLDRLMARIRGDAFEPVENRRPDLGSSFSIAIERSLEKAPDDRLSSGAEFLKLLDRDNVSSEMSSWWRLHQLVVIALYFVACALAWQVKEWQPGITTPLFVAAGVVATVAGVLRGHLLFVAATAARRLAAEYNRLVHGLLATDVLLGTIMTVDGVLLAATRPLPGVLTIALGVGIALVRIVVEPTTTAASLRRAGECASGA